MDDNDEDVPDCVSKLKPPFLRSHEGGGGGGVWQGDRNPRIKEVHGRGKKRGQGAGN